MRDYLISEIEKRKIAIAKIDSERDALTQRRHALNIELTVYVDVLAQFNQSADQTLMDTRKNDQTLKDDRKTEGIPSLIIPVETKNTKRTRLSYHWRPVMQSAVERYPEALSYSEIPEIQQKAGYQPVPRRNIRTYMHKLVGEGLYARAGYGKVRATEAAAKLLGISLGTDSEAAHRTEAPDEDQSSGASKANGALPLNF